MANRYNGWEGKDGVWLIRCIGLPSVGPFFFCQKAVAIQVVLRARRLLLNQRFCLCGQITSQVRLPENALLVDQEGGWE